MVGLRWLVAVAGLCWAVAASAAPLEAYGRLPAVETAAVSPSGHAVAAISTTGEERILVVRDLVANKILLNASAGNLKVRTVQWAGDKHLVIVTSVTAAPMFILNARREWMTAYILDLTTSKVRPILRDIPNGMNTIFDMPVVREFGGEPAIFAQGVRFNEGRGQLSLYRVDIDTGRSRLVGEGGADTRDWLVGVDGQPVAQELYNLSSGRWTLKVKTGGAWRDIQSVIAPIDRPYVLGLGRDGKSVLYAMPDQEHGAAWREARVDGGAPGAPLPGMDDQEPIRDPQSGALIGHYTLVGDEARYVFFDPEDARVWSAIEKAYPGQSVSLVSWSADRKKIVVLVDSPTEGPAFALVDLNTKKGSWLGSQYAGVSEKDIGPKRAIRFKAADGLELGGYLTLPPGRAAKNLPLVVFPHGGPASRDTPGFDWWAQAMASRGYAVLQVNFRGSDGLGADLLRAGYGQWGRKMQTDLSDGVKHLAGQGLIDPKRVCIVGASYGGYAALAGATLQQGIYRCAASVAGVADLRRHVAYARTRGGQAAGRYWERFLGVDDAGAPLLAELSPAQNAAKASIPVLLVHGRDDTVVPLEQSRIMAEALQKAGKPVELVVQKGEDHWLSRGETRLETLRAIVGFLEKHNPPS